MTDQDTRPVFLSLTRIHMPVMAVLSIGHRLTGVLLVGCIPISIYLLELSLSGEHGFRQMLDVLSTSWFRGLLIVFVWVIAHHFYAGMRYLLIDIDIGVGLRSGRRGAWIVIGAGILTMFATAIALL